MSRTRIFYIYIYMITCIDMDGVMGRVWVGGHAPQPCPGEPPNHALGEPWPPRVHGPSDLHGSAHTMGLHLYFIYICGSSLCGTCRATPAIPRGGSTRRAIKLESEYLQYAHVHTDAAPLAALCSEHCSNSVLWFDLRQLASAVVSEETCLGHPLQPFALSIAPTQCYGLI